MSESYEIIPLRPRREQLVTALGRCNALSAQYGLLLSEADIAMLADRQMAALQGAGRVEFGRGPFEKLIYAFCDSSYITQADYAGLLAELCALFYRFKGESGEQWSDDELVAEMARLFAGCQGSVELMADRLWQALHTSPEENGGEEDTCER